MIGIRRDCRNTTKVGRDAPRKHEGRRQTAPHLPHYCYHDRSRLFSIEFAAVQVFERPIRASSDYL